MIADSALSLVSDLDRVEVDEEAVHVLVEPRVEVEDAIKQCYMVFSKQRPRIVCVPSSPTATKIDEAKKINLGLLLVDADRPGRSYQGRFKASEGQGQFYCDLPRDWRFGIANVQMMISIVHEGQSWDYPTSDAYPMWAVDRFADGAIVFFEKMPVEDAKAISGSFDQVLREKHIPIPVKTGYAPVLFDVSDLLAYFKDSRLPTGIQRVQVEIISSLIHTPTGREIEIVAFDQDRDAWVSIPASFFNHLAVFSLKSGDINEQIWVEAKADIVREIKTGALYKFIGEEQLVNLGTSWWIKNYFLSVRRAIEKHNVSYIPFVHDFIPIVLPEHCMRNLSGEFMDWASSVLSHADRFLVNSNSTKTDLVKLAKDSGQADTIHVQVVTLDADISLSSNDISLPTVFAGHQRTSPDFVLFVSTIESRKNHCLLLDVWMLMERRGLTDIPDLVFVGKRGWLNDHVYAKVESSSFLQQKVHFLSDVSDEGLSRLYESCLFLAYPSFYEGWGLPVTEALCFGKVPVVSNVSSLPEAAGGFGDWFDPYSTSDAYEKISALITDRSLIKAKEEEIAKHFKPRTWQEISSQIIESLDHWYFEPRMKSEKKMVSLGTKVSLGSKKLDWPVEFNNSERYRAGSGWWWPEDWGVWTKHCGGEISFALPPEAIGSSVMVAFWIRGVQGQRCDVSVDGMNVHTSLSVGSADIKTVLIEFRASQKEVTFCIRSKASTDFAVGTGGADPRVAGCGVCGFAVALKNDLATRITLLEEIGFDKVHGIS